MPKQILTANRLGDGLVVYLTELGTWSEAIDDARVAAGAEDAALLETLGRAREATEVSGPYLIEVELEGGCLTPVRYRERIRAHGPSIREPRARETAPGHFKPPSAPVHRAAG